LANRIRGVLNYTWLSQSIRSLLIVTSLGCAPSRPAFVEPSWGDAPPPLPEQIAEITLDRTRCNEACQSIRLVLRRNGYAESSYLTGKRQDSLFFATIDSVTFRDLAIGLVVGGLFQGKGADPGVLEPFATSATVVSASILCRRFVEQWDERRVTPASRPARLTGPIDSVTRRLSWRRCCKA
jgi:hypothetical protein